MQWSSPLESAGFNRFEASIDPSLAPAPTSMCNSSINKIISPSAFATSVKTDFSRSSNSPLNLAPAIREPRSKLTNLQVLKLSGTSPCTIL